LPPPLDFSDELALAAAFGFVSAMTFVFLKFKISGLVKKFWFVHD
jgi:hypothetical protein